MRCFLSERLQESLAGRMSYFNKALNLWVIPNDRVGTFTVLGSIPSNCLDLCFIIGHNGEITALLKNNEIKEKVVVIITCDLKTDFSKLFSRNQEIYIANQKEYVAELFSGAEFGFDFDLTESEVIFYNNRRNEDLDARLEQAYTKIQ